MDSKKSKKSSRSRSKSKSKTLKEKNPKALELGSHYGGLNIKAEDDMASQISKSPSKKSALSKGKKKKKRTKSKTTVRDDEDEPIEERPDFQASEISPGKKSKA